MPLQLENIQAIYAELKTAVQHIEEQVNSQAQKLQKIVTDFEHHERLCGCGDMTMDDRMKWLPGQQAELLKLLMQIDEQFKYFSAQTKEMADFMRVCRPCSEPSYSEVSVISVIKEFLTYKQFFLDCGNTECPCRNSAAIQLQSVFLNGQIYAN